MCAWWAGQPVYGSNPVSKFIRENFAYLKTYTDYILNSGVTTADLAAVHASPPTLAAVVNITVNTTISNTDVGLGGGYNISGGVVLTINGAFSAPVTQIFFGAGTVVFGVGSVPEVYPEWWGVTAAAINSACAALTSGGTVKLTAPTYTLANATIVCANNNVRLEVNEGTILNSTQGDLDFTFKFTGSRCSIKGGTIQCPANFSIFAGALVNLRKAIIWLTNTADDFTLEGVKFINIPTIGFFNEGADRVTVKDCTVFGGYTTYLVEAGFNHFFYYQDGGSNQMFLDNTIVNCGQGIGSGTYGQLPGERVIARGNFFDSIGQHPIYLDNGGDYSIIEGNTQANCGSSYAVSGYGCQVNNNNVHVDPTLWTSGVAYQSAISFRNSIGGSCCNNIISGKGYYVLIGFENINIGGVDPRATCDNLVSGNNIYCTSGAIYDAIRMGSRNYTTSCLRNKIVDNRITAYVDTAFDLINVSASAVNQVVDCDISGNTLVNMSTNQFNGIRLDFGNNCTVKENTVVTRQVYGVGTVAIGVFVIKTANSIFSDNLIIGTEATNLAHYGFYESGTNAEVHDNVYTNNQFDSAAVAGNNIPYLFVAGNNSIMQGNFPGAPYTWSTAATHYLRLGSLIFLTGATRNFDPGGEVYPVGYQLDIYNIAAVDSMTFDSTGLAAVIATGEHGIFCYTGTGWAGGVF